MPAEKTPKPPAAVVARLPQRAAAEVIGTALLLAIVIGSGIMGEALCGGNVAVALLANSIATGAGLMVLVWVFGTISGAHFNPLVTLADALQGGLPWREVPAYVVSQMVGAFSGVALVHGMFDRAPFGLSATIRTGTGHLLAEFVATFGLLLVILVCSKRRPGIVPLAIGSYITAAYWFTSSTSFANPAVTLARTLTGTFAGIRLVDAPGFVIVQLLGGGAAVLLSRWFLSASCETAAPKAHGQEMLS